MKDIKILYSKTHIPKKIGWIKNSSMSDIKLILKKCYTKLGLVEKLQYERD